MSIYKKNNIDSCIYIYIVDCVYQVGPPSPPPPEASSSSLPPFPVAGLLVLSFWPLPGEGPSEWTPSCSWSWGWLRMGLTGREGWGRLREDFRHLRYMMRDFQVNHLRRETGQKTLYSRCTQWQSTTSTPLTSERCPCVPHKLRNMSK